MKKLMMALVAAMMMSASAMAQDNQQQGRQPRQFNPEEMAKQRTEQMVKEYGLTEEQGKKLLDLNTKFMDKMPMMGRGFRGGQRGQRPQTDGERPQREETAPQGERPQRPQFNPEEMRKNMEEYNAELEKILTAEQLQKYKDNMQRRMQRGPQGNRRGGNRQQRNND